jgi:hypothetical protein
LIIQNDRDNADIRIPVELCNVDENVYESVDENLINDPAQKIE